MPIINIPKSDMMQDLIPAGWYKGEVLSFDVKPPKNGGNSLNYVPKIKLLAEKGTPGHERELNVYFNSQAIGRIAPFVAAVTEKSLKEIVEETSGANFQLDTDTVVGKKLQVKVINEQFEGRMVAKIDGFAPYNAAPAF